MSGNEDTAEMFDRISKAVDEKYARDFPAGERTRVSRSHVGAIRERLEGAGRKDVVMTGTEEHAQLADKSIRAHGGKPDSVKKAVEAIESQASELQTARNRSAAPEQMRLNGVEPGSVAKAVRSIENSQASEGRLAQLDDRQDRTRAAGRTL